MKKWLLILLLFPFSVSAQFEEQWLCGADKSAGFVFRDGQWIIANFLPENAMFTLDGVTGVVEFPQAIHVLECEINGAHLSCTDDVQQFVFDRETGRAGFSSLQGALIQSNAFISLFQCTKT